MNKLSTNSNLKRLTPKIEDLARIKATDAQWSLCDEVIKSFIREHLSLWIAFQKSLQIERSESNPYKLANKKEKELRKANFRHSASFPNAEFIQVIEKIIPGLTHPNSVNYTKFLKKYPFFKAGEKY